MNKAEDDFNSFVFKLFLVFIACSRAISQPWEASPGSEIWRLGTRRPCWFTGNTV